MEEHRRSGATFLLDLVRYALILFGTWYVLRLLWSFSWIVALVAAIPVFVVMLNVCGFVTLPFYALTPEVRAKRAALRDFERTLTSPTRKP
jgi:hypothetical protein